MPKPNQPKHQGQKVLTNQRQSMAGYAKKSSETHINAGETASVGLSAQNEVYNTQLVIWQGVMCWNYFLSKWEDFVG